MYVSYYKSQYHSCDQICIWEKKKIFQLLQWPFRGLQMGECREAEMGDLRSKSRMEMSETKLFGNPYLVALISVDAIFFESIINRTW